MVASGGVDAARSMPYSLGGSSLLWSSPSQLTAATASSADVDPLSNNGHLRTAAQQAPQTVAWDSAHQLHGEEPGLQLASSTAVQDQAACEQYPARTSGAVTPVSAVSGRQHSSSTCEPSTPKNSLELQHLQAQLGTGPFSPAAGASHAAGASRAQEERRSAVYALLKARNDMAVLRELKIGPLLGRGSYGRVYRGMSLSQHSPVSKCKDMLQTYEACWEPLRVPGQRPVSVPLP